MRHALVITTTPQRVWRIVTQDGPNLTRTYLQRLDSDGGLAGAHFDRTYGALDTAHFACAARQHLKSIFSNLELVAAKPKPMQDLDLPISARPTLQVTFFTISVLRSTRTFLVAFWLHFLPTRLESSSDSMSISQDPPVLHPGEKVVLPHLSTEELDSTHLRSTQHDEPPVQRVRGFWWAIVLISIVSSTFLYSLDNTVMANIRPDIVDSLGHMEMLPWMSVSYPLGEVGTCPFW
jgi:hypothetical protein